MVRVAAAVATRCTRRMSEHSLEQTQSDGGPEEEEGGAAAAELQEKFRKQLTVHYLILVVVLSRVFV